MWEFLTVSRHLAKFVVNGSSASEDPMCFICHLTLPDHFNELSYEFIGESSLQYLITLTRLVTIEILIVEICF